MMVGLLGWNLVAAIGCVAREARAEAADTCPSARREVAELRRALEQKDAALKAMSLRVRNMARGNIQAIESALSGTGLKVDNLIKRGAGKDQGGPFIPAGPLLHEDVWRWDRLNRALQVLPLAAPLREYEVTSGFGRRKDPFNRRRAMHEGIDLKAPIRAPVLSTGPGRVVYAGRKGGFGRLVEIDHGLGVRTRYGHLAAIHVTVGQEVRVGTRVGLLGSSGRSTGPHLHYEVLVDGRARNPQPFLKAGVRLERGALTVGHR